MAGLVSSFLGLFIHIQGEYAFEWQQDLRLGRPQVDCLDVLMALLTHIEPVDSFIIGEIGQVFLLLVATIGTL